jgi:hypothetical protein
VSAPAYGRGPGGASDLRPSCDARAVTRDDPVPPRRLVPDAIWRVRHHQVRRDAVQASHDDLGIDRIAADEPVPAEEPDVASRADRVLRQGRGLIGIG